MSQFLAPIHTWLFDKIVLMESIEKEIVNQYSDSKYQDAHAKVHTRIWRFYSESAVGTTD